MKKNKEIKLNEKITKCGESIPSNFKWLTLEEQKKRAEELNKISKNNKNS